MNETKCPQRDDTHFMDVRDPHDGSLLFRYDPVRKLVEIRKRKVVRLIDLARLRAVDNQRDR